MYFGAVKKNIRKSFNTPCFFIFSEATNNDYFFQCLNYISPVLGSQRLSDDSCSIIDEAESSASKARDLNDSILSSRYYNRLK